MKRRCVGRSPSRTTKWRKEKGKLTTCPCEFHQAVWVGAQQNKCNCEYHKSQYSSCSEEASSSDSGHHHRTRPSCCMYHGDCASFGDSNTSDSSRPSSEDENSSITELHLEKSVEGDGLLPNSEMHLNESGCGHSKAVIQNLLTADTCKETEPFCGNVDSSTDKPQLFDTDGSTSSDDSLEKCSTMRVHLRPHPHREAQEDYDTASDSSTSEDEEDPSDEPSSPSSSSGGVSEDEDPEDNRGQQNNRGGDIGPGHDDDPDPDDPGPGINAVVDNSDSDPDGDIADDVNTFSFGNPLLDAPLVLDNDDRTRRELLAMIIALSVRSRLDYETITKLLRIVNLSLGREQMPETKKTLWNSLGRTWLGIKKHAYCSSCHDYLGLLDNLPLIVVCELCGKRARRGSVHFFITMNVRNQLQSLLNEPGAWEKLQYPQRRVKRNPDAVEDILDGEAYQRIQKGPYDFTYQFNLDPFSTSKSSKTEVCPIFLKLNELPPNLRQKNVLLAGLWLGPKDIDYNFFMKNFRKQCNKLAERGITWRPDPNGPEQISRFYCTCGVCDAVGRAGILNIHTHAGKYSCPYCEHPAIKLEGAMKFPLPGTVVQRRRRVQGQDIVENVLIPEAINLRTDASVRRDMALAAPQNTGFKGPAEVALINNFNLSHGFSTDDLHPLYLGVTLFHTELLLEGVPGVYAVTKRQVKIISRRLTAIKTPTNISRKPRGIHTRAKWKGSEWRNWLLYYSAVCFDGIIPNQYLRHFGLLSEAIFLLSRDSVSEDDFRTTDRLLTEYHTLFQQFYGPENMRYNIHILTHVVQCVRLWGPLWAISTMPYESWNYTLRKCVSSPKGALDQICMRYLMTILVRGIPHNPQISDEVKELVQFIQDGLPKEYREVGGAYYFGVPRVRAPTDRELEVLRELNYNCQNLTVYPQVKINSFVCRSAAYRDDIKSCNCFMYTTDDTFHSIDEIVVFQNEEELLGGMFTSIIEVNPREPLHGMSHVVPIEDADEKTFILAETVRNLAIKMIVNEMEYITPLSNQLEID